MESIVGYSTKTQNFRGWRWIKQFEWSGLLLAIVLTGIGIINLASAVPSAQAGDIAATYWSRQLQWWALSIPCMLLLAHLRYRWVVACAWIFYVLSLVLLSMTFFDFGRVKYGQALWIELPGIPITFQPAEFCKIAMIVMLAKVLGKREHPPTTVSDLFLPGLITLIPVLGIIKQGDLGTAIVFIPTALGMCFVAGYRGGLMAALLSPVLGLMGIAQNKWVAWLWLGLLVSLMLWMIAERMRWWEIVLLVMAQIFVFAACFNYFDELWLTLKPYQQERIIAFWDPEQSPQASGWQYRQAAIAVGAGGLLGVGWGEGTQSNLRFLPEFHTDFAFATFIEQWGFIGGVVLMSLLLLYLLRGLQIASDAPDRTGAVLATGIVMLCITHVGINIAMNIGLMPITGLPLNFMSYGGSFLLTNYLGLGLLMSVHAGRYDEYYLYH